MKGRRAAGANTDRDVAAAIRGGGGLRRGEGDGIRIDGY
jgi:hypothetical protein